jgi:hypothetical protein
MSRLAIARAGRRVQALAGLAILIAIALATEAGKRWIP